MLKVLKNQRDITNVIEQESDRPDLIVSILKAANFSGGVTLAKIIERVDLIEPAPSLKQYAPSLKQYLSVLEKNGLPSFQKGEQIYRTTYKGMNFLQTYNRSIGLSTN
jgi:predicted transcriptional regulator